jgi:hypothetical protein
MNYGYKPISGNLQSYVESVVSKTGVLLKKSNIDHYSRDQITDMTDQIKEIEVKVDPKTNEKELMQRKIMSKLSTKPIQFEVNGEPMVSWLGYNMLLSDFYVVFGFVSGLGTGFNRDCIEFLGNRLNALNGETGIHGRQNMMTTVLKILEHCPNLTIDDLNFLESY